MNNELPMIPKPIPPTLKLMLGALTLGLCAGIIKLIVLQGLSDPKQAEIIYNIADIFFIFSTMFITLATSSYIYEKRGK